MKIFVAIFLLMMFACTPDHYETKATIIERRVLDNNGLLIKYSFQAGTETIIDSVRTTNKVIPHDSLMVKYSASDPRTNTLKFEWELVVDKLSKNLFSKFCWKQFSITFAIPKNKAINELANLLMSEL